MGNLVNSNVFLRGALLAVETLRCDASDSPTHTPPAALARQLYSNPLATCRVARWFRACSVRLLRDLALCLPVADVHQDTVCVVNSALTILLLARRRGTLPVLIQVRSRSRRSAAARRPRASRSRLRARACWQQLRSQDEGACTPGRATRALRAYLWFWQHYYHFRGREAMVLELSSRIPFEYWRALVQELCADDGSPHALMDAPFAARNPFVEREIGFGANVGRLVQSAAAARSASTAADATAGAHGSSAEGAEGTWASRNSRLSTSPHAR